MAKIAIICGGVIGSSIGYSLALAGAAATLS
jgi:glycine/D-amino acid oxidase-like deaminating enzyme